MKIINYWRINIRPFLFITILAALVMAGTAALFSVTGISNVFAGHFIQVAIMAGALETGKIVIASILYRYWVVMNTAIKSYMIIALFVLMIITSAGIFGYLSEAYQKTKGSYDVLGKEVELLISKKQLFQNEYDRYETRLGVLIGIRSSQEIRLDSLYAKNYTTSARRVETNIKRQDDEITNLNKQLLAMADSISSIETKVVITQSTIITGDLGPLQYVAQAFGTDMDTAVKFFILILIFVFDPLAVTLIVAANMIFVNKHYERKEWTGVFGKKKEEQEMKEVDKYLASDEAKNLIKRINKTQSEIPIKKWETPTNKSNTKFDADMLETVVEDANEEFDEEIANVIFPEETPLEVLPADKTALMIDTKIPIVDDNSQHSDVKIDEPAAYNTKSIYTESIIDKPKEEIQPKKKKTIFSWKSANWRDSK